MRFAWFTKLSLVLSVCGLVSGAFAQKAQPAVVNEEPSAGNVQASDLDDAHGTYPQIVRVSLVEGDVRVFRGKENEKATGTAWESVTGDVPLESGYALVTGRGRAEIEFEDASTIYLGENSVLRFHDLSTKDGVPRTKMELLSGTVTLHLQPTIAGESYQLETTEDKIGVPYPSKVYVRVNSYLDGLTATPMEETEIVTNHKARGPGAQGQTLIYRAGDPKGQPSRSPDHYKSWDAWVRARVDEREKTLKELMSAAGLTTPIPGLADLSAQGTFFPCEPYGTCWQPKDAWGAGEDAADSIIASVVVSSAGLAAGQGMQLAGNGGQVVSTKHHADLTDFLEDDDFFPCPAGYYRESGIDPSRYDWAVCHHGSWIYRSGRLAWVAGPNRHHRCPVRWVSVGGKVGFVPLHPRDVAGKAPVNLKHGVYALGSTDGARRLQRQAAGDERVKVLAEVPKEFRREALPTLAHASAPVVEAHVLRDGFQPVGKVQGPTQTGAARPVSTIQFDGKSHNFTVATTVMNGGRQSSFVERIGGNAGMPVRSGEALSGRGGASGGGAAGGAGSHGGAMASGGSGGGGSHGGGGSSGVSVASSSAPSSGGSSAASAGGGGGGGRSK